MSSTFSRSDSNDFVIEHQRQRMARDASAQSLLLALPDPCLLAVLQFCAAGDQRSLFCAAAAHSKLHRVAVSILHSITAVVATQQHVNGVMQFLRRHGQHIDSVTLRSLQFSWNILDGPDEDELVKLYQLPVNLHLTNLQLECMCLPRPGVLRSPALASLKQLRLSDCELLNGGNADAFRQALVQLPADSLEHLSLQRLLWNSRHAQLFTGVLDRLVHLTYLELAEMEVLGQYYDRPVLQPLQALTRLVDLRLEDLFEEYRYGEGSILTITASMLSVTQALTCLGVSGKSEDEHFMDVEPAVLAGKTLLQHLLLQDCRITGGPAGAAQLLLHVQPLQQLTELSLSDSLKADGEARGEASGEGSGEGSPPAAARSPPAAAYSALTASSKLEVLDLRRCTLPEGVWQHLFPAGRQLPQLQILDISEVYHPNQSLAAAPEGSRLVSCCPGLQTLFMPHLTLSSKLLMQLPRLSGLHTLELCPEAGTYGSMGEGFEAVCKLTGLRELSVRFDEAAGEGLLLQLAQLKQLTRLTYEGPVNGSQCQVDMASEVPEDEPVWRQVLRWHLGHSDLALAQQAAAALAE